MLFSPAITILYLLIISFFPTFLNKLWAARVEEGSGREGIWVVAFLVKLESGDCLYGRIILVWISNQILLDVTSDKVWNT